MTVEIESLFGLPAHPLVVHAAVVLLPLAALATLAAAVVPKARRAGALIALGLALVATISVGLAQGSGEALEERVDETQLVEAHTDSAEMVLPWAIALTIVAAGVAGSGLLQRRYPKLSATNVTAVLVLAALITGAGSVWAIGEVGHSGAKATWSNLPAGEQEHGEGDED
jgi:hypothetical protein